jgi:hypothetical protein
VVREPGVRESPPCPQSPPDDHGTCRQPDRGSLDDLLADPQLLELRGSAEEAAAARILSRALRPVQADELAAAVLVDHPRADPWATTRILGAVLEACSARHRPTMRQIAADLAAAGDRVSLGLVATTVVRARAAGLRTEGCEPYRTAEGLPRRRRCTYRVVEWTPATVAVTADRQVRAAVLLAARLLRDLGALAVRTVARAVRRGTRALLELWRQLRGDPLAVIAPNSVNTVSRGELDGSPNTGAGLDARRDRPGVNVEGVADLRSSTPDGGPGGTEQTHQGRPRSRRPSRESRMLGELLGDHAGRVHEGNVPWTAAALLRLAVAECWPDPLRAAHDAYSVAVSTVLSDAPERERSSSPIRNPARWAARVARRLLQRQEPPPWPGRGSPAVWPPASPSAPTAGGAAVTPLLEVGPAPLPAAPGGPDLVVEGDQAAWDALDAGERTRAEARVRGEAPALARWTHERGAVWCQAVVEAAAGLAAADAEGLQ